MATIRERILAQLKVVLTGQLGAGVTVDRARSSSIEMESALHVNIVPEGDPRTDGGGNEFTDRRMTVDFQIHARGDTPDQLADPVVDALHNRLMADRSLGMGGSVIDLEAGDNDFDWSDADSDLCVVHQRYEILYRTDETNLSA